MEVAVAAIIAATAAAVGVAVLLYVYRLITLLGDPVNAKPDERLAKLDERGRRLKGRGARRALGKA